MKSIPLAALALLQVSCLTPLTDRLDALQTELHRVNTQLAETNQQLIRANAQLEKVEQNVRGMGNSN
ncbi:MAG TPA: hypothetical protein PKA06_11845 [Gemmatales bacterium]|nr:hypothetical protein [Gemmatales bacterium]HMP16743.1 hypothetical protein [Gemmatales bacterium]